LVSCYECVNERLCEIWGISQPAEQFSSSQVGFCSMEFVRIRALGSPDFHENWCTDHVCADKMIKIHVNGYTLLNKLF
jgi:hypothetical protein